MELNKNIKRDQLLVVKEDFVYNSSCSGKKTIKKGLIVRNAWSNIPRTETDEMLVSTGTTSRTIPANKLRSLVGAEKFYAKERFNQGSNWDEERYVD